MNEASACRLSVVATSRNDDHGGDVLARTRLFVRGLLEQTRRHAVPMELVLVDWNPPPDRPPLREVLPAPQAGDCLRIRHVVVPPAVHRRFRNADNIPLFQMMAKNVGIRRARGEFVLCTNVDLLFSDALMRRLAEPLRADRYYRCNRCDVPGAIDYSLGLDALLDWCAHHVIRRQGRDPRYRHANLESLGLGDKGPLKKWLFDKLALGMRVAAWSAAERDYYQLDSFACGDFTLMSRAAWRAIRGYVELDLYSLHVDTLALISATAAGYRQHVWPTDACTYHVDHANGWSALSPLEKLAFIVERPAIDYSLLREIGLYALERREPILLNGGDWGFADLDFDEWETAPPPAPGRGAAAGRVAGGAAPVLPASGG